MEIKHDFLQYICFRHMLYLCYVGNLLKRYKYCHLTSTYVTFLVRVVWLVLPGQPENVSFRGVVPSAEDDGSLCDIQPESFVLFPLIIINHHDWMNIKTHTKMNKVNKLKSMSIEYWPNWTIISDIAYYKWNIINFGKCLPTWVHHVWGVECFSHIAIFWCPRWKATFPYSIHYLPLGYQNICH